MNADAVAAVPRTIEQLMAQALALERDAVERYREFADIMQAHNNQEVAALFCALADQETLHAERILQRMGWIEVPRMPDLPGGPPAPPLEDAHYLMQPWHALQLALRAEQRAHDFFADIAGNCEPGELQRTAQEMQAEEAEHIAIIRSMLERMPVPEQNWAEDPDPPRYND